MRDTPPAFDVSEVFARISNCKTVTYKKAQPIFSQGDPADSVFYIQSGQIKITVVSEHGKEAVVAVLKQNEFFGENCLTGLARRITTASAFTECVIARMAKAEIMRVLREDHDFSSVFIAHLLTRNMRAQGDLVDQLFNSSERRLARALLLLANYGKEDGPQPVLVKISQETLAEMIGTTRPRVNFFMNKFRKLGLIDYNGTIKVHSSLLNVILHDEPRG